VTEVTATILHAYQPLHRPDGSRWIRAGAHVVSDAAGGDLGHSRLRSALAKAAHRQLKQGETAMSSQATSANREARSRVRKVIQVVDRIGLWLIYVFVIAVLPLAAVGHLTRTV
jgi:hypothetical protein